MVLFDFVTIVILCQATAPCFVSHVWLIFVLFFLALLSPHLEFGKELFIMFAASAFRKLSSIYVFSYFPFGFEGRIWDLIVSVPDHCLSFYLEKRELAA